MGPGLTWRKGSRRMRHSMLRMNDPMTRWRAEHANFAALLDLLEEELAAFHDGGEPDYGLMLGEVPQDGFRRLRERLRGGPAGRSTRPCSGWQGP